MTKKTTKEFTAKVDELVKLSKPRIAFGLLEPDKEILASLQRSQKYADIVLVGPKNIESIKDFELVISEEPEKKIADMLFNKEVEGIVRGTIDDLKTLEAYSNLSDQTFGANPGLMETVDGHQFFLAFIGNLEAWNNKEKLAKVLLIAQFMKNWTIKPKIALLTGVRHETYNNTQTDKLAVRKMLNKTYEDAQYLEKELTKSGFDAKNWAIDSNLALKDSYNLIVPPNGMVGNQMFRMILVGGGKILTATRMGFSQPYEDNSRSEKDFDFHIKWLVAMINQKKSNG